MKNQNGIQGLFNLLSSQAIKTPKSKGQNQFSSFFSQLNSSNPRTPSHKPNKSYSSMINPKNIIEEQYNQARNKDYIKKIIFDNQQLTRRIKDVEDRNTWLEDENRRIQEMYNELKQSFGNLRQKYTMLAHDVEDELPEKLIQAKQNQGGQLLGLLIKGLTSTTSPKTQARNTNLKSKHSINSFQLSPRRKSSMMRKKVLEQPLNVKKQEIVQNKQIQILNRTTDSETQTQIKCILHEDPFRLSPSSQEAQLLLQISTYKSSLQQTQRNYAQLLTKYERIKAIISGDPK